MSSRPADLKRSSEQIDDEFKQPYLGHQQQSTNELKSPQASGEIENPMNHEHEPRLSKSSTAMNDQPSGPEDTRQQEANRLEPNFTACQIPNNDMGAQQPDGMASDQKNGSRSGNQHYSLRTLSHSK